MPKAIRQLTPFPPPDEKLCEHFGRTMYYAQKLEREFKLLLLTAEALGRIKIDREQFKTTGELLLKKNLGGLIKILRSGSGLNDSSLKKLLYDACEDRNKLAHAFFANIDPQRLTSKQREELLSELGRIRLSVGNAFLVIREFRRVAEEQIGITEEQIQSLLDKLEAGSH